MMDDLVSIIIPVYNAEIYLQRCLDSVLGQIYAKLEVIVINDGSTDGSADICEEYAQSDSRIKVIHKENGGVSSARNSGLDTASGGWIGFVDADDWVEPDMFEKLMNAAKKSGSQITICGHTDYRGDAAKIKSKAKHVGFLDREKAIKCLLAYDFFEGYLWNKLFKSSLIKDIRLDNDIHFCEDVLFCTQAFMSANNVCYIADTLYHHCLSKDGAMLSFNKKRLTELTAWERTACVLEPISRQLAKIAKCRYADAAIAQYYYMGHQCSDYVLKHRLRKEATRYLSLYLIFGVTPFRMKIKGVIKLMFPQAGRLVAYCKQKESA